MKRYFYSLFFLLISLNLFSQTDFSFGVSGVVHEDTVSMGDSISFEFWIVNTSSVNFTDSIYISCETFDINAALINSMNIGSFYNNLSSLNSGDSLFISISNIVTPQSYVLGDNIVVIWPASFSSISVDTSITNVHVLGGNTSVFTDFSNQDLLLFPNPVKDYLQIYSLNYMINRLYIYDSLGKNILFKYNIDSRDYSVNTMFLDKGIYFMHLYINNHLIVKKFIVN